MESIYYVLCWACHRRCTHCYETRFRPYVGEDLRRVVNEAKATFPLVIDHLPEDFTYLDLSAPSETASGGYVRRPGRIVLAGGEVLVDPVREEVLYPVLEAIHARYADQRVRVVVQTTGDLVTAEIVDELLARGVWMVSCAGMDDFHVGMEGQKRVAIEADLRAIFEAAGTLLVEEAGGCVSDMDGSPYRLRTRAVLGSAPGVHVELQRLLEGALATRSEDLEGA